MDNFNQFTCIGYKQILTEISTTLVKLLSDTCWYQPLINICYFPWHFAIANEYVPWTIIGGCFGLLQYLEH